jgi:F420-non-reducing hydrogenase iron-sulfur subunit
MDSNGLQIVCFSCKFGWGYLTGDETIRALVPNSIPVICTGKIDAANIIDAFERKADGVLILACPEGKCHYQDGNCEARKKVLLIQKIMEAQGIEHARLKIIMDSDPEGTRIPALVDEFKAELIGLSQQLVREYVK